MNSEFTCIVKMPKWQNTGEKQKSKVFWPYFSCDLSVTWTRPAASAYMNQVKGQQKGQAFKPTTRKVGWNLDVTESDSMRRLFFCAKSTKIQTAQFF